MTTEYPLLFGYRDLVAGEGFLAGIQADGRALMVREGDEHWMYGVNPGGLAAKGSTQEDASRAFRQTYSEVIVDIAEAAAGFEDFRRRIVEFFDEVCGADEKRWQGAVARVKEGKVDSDWLPKQPADSPRGVQIIRIRKPEASDNARGFEQLAA